MGAVKKKPVAGAKKAAAKPKPKEVKASKAKKVVAVKRLAKKAVTKAKGRPVGKKAVVVAKVKKAAGKAKKAESSAEESDEEPKGKKRPPKAKNASKAKKSAKAVESSEDSDGEKEETKKKPAKAKKVAKAAKKAAVSKVANKDSNEDDESGDEKTKKKPVAKAKKSPPASSKKTSPAKSEAGKATKAKSLKSSGSPAKKRTAGSKAKEPSSDEEQPITAKKKVTTSPSKSPKKSSSSAEAKKATVPKAKSMASAASAVKSKKADKSVNSSDEELDSKKSPAVTKRKVPAANNKKAKKATTKAGGAKTVVTSSTDDESDSEVESTPVKKKTAKPSRGSAAKAAQGRISAAKAKKAVIVSSDDEAESDTEDVVKSVVTNQRNKKPISRKRPAPKTTKATKAKKAAVVQKSSSESSSSDSESEIDSKTKSKPTARKAKKVIVKKKATAKDKVKAAQAKLKLMQKSGFWGAPPRRAASLNAAAMVHFMYDNEQPLSSLKAALKASKASSESSPPVVRESFDEDQMLATTAKVNSSKVKKGSSKGQKKAKKKASQPIYSKNQSDTTSTSESEDSSSESEVELVKAKKTPMPRKKAKKDEFKLDFKDMIVKKRLASLNASAIMSASYAQEKPKAESLATALVPYSPSQAKANLKKAEKAKKAAAKAEKAKPEPRQIIFEIEDERIKSQLIASAMKKAKANKAKKASNGSGNKEQNVFILKASDALKAKEMASSKLPPKKRSHEGHQSRPKGQKKAKILRVVESSSSSSSASGSSSESEIEEITTEGARLRPNSASSSNPMALKTEMNKVDVIVDGRSVAGMYQVIQHRFETISTTTAVVPRSVADDQQVQNESNGGLTCSSRAGNGAPGGRYTPLGALASLQPPTGNQPQSGPRFPTGAASTYHQPPQPHFAPHQGFYQPAGPLIRSASPGGTSSVAAPPTATVQPTVVTSVASNRPSAASATSGTSACRDSEFSPSQKDPGSPVKPTPTPQVAPPSFQPGYPYFAAAAAAAAAAPPFYPPPPHPFYQATPPHGAPPPPAMQATPFAPQPYAFDYRGFPLYPPPAPPQYGSYYLAPALSYHPSTATSTVTSNSEGMVPPPSVAAPPPSAYFYGGYTYPYSHPGRIVAPILALAPPAAAPPAPPTAAAPPAVAPMATSSTTTSAAIFNFHPPTLQPQVEPPAPKNSQAGPPGVGKGGSNSPQPPHANKSALRDYRRPKQPHKLAPASEAAAVAKYPTSSTASTAAKEFAKALSGSEVSVTAVLGPKNPNLAAFKAQPPVVSMFPVSAPAASPRPSKSPKPPVLTPEVEVIKTSKASKNNNNNNGLPVLHIPEYIPTSSFGGSVHKKTLKKGLQQPQLPRGSSGGHPGMPNGLLQLSTSLQPLASKITPKVDQSPASAASKKAMVASPISVSMAKSGIMKKSTPPKPRATLLKPSSTPKRPKNMYKTSPESSRSSSRNSSVSPRERPPPQSLAMAKNRASPPSGMGAASKKQAKNPVTCAKLMRPLVPWSKRNLGPPKNSNGWSWVGEGHEQKVYLNNEDAPVSRVCYSSMKHVEGDVVTPRDCILVASGNRKKDLPFVAKVTALWENPDDGEMCMSLFWYYRPEHLDCGRKPYDTMDEIYASRHRDHTSVACIEDKCYVMTYNEYCRYRKFLRMVEEGVAASTSIVPDPMGGYDRAHQLPNCRVAPDRVFLCRRVYDSSKRRLFKNPA